MTHDRRRPASPMNCTDVTDFTKEKEKRSKKERENARRLRRSIPRRGGLAPPLQTDTLMTQVGSVYSPMWVPFPRRLPLGRVPVPSKAREPISAWKRSLWGSFRHPTCLKSPVCHAGRSENRFLDRRSLTDRRFDSAGGGGGAGPGMGSSSVPPVCPVDLLRQALCDPFRGFLTKNAAHLSFHHLFGRLLVPWQELRKPAREPERCRQILIHEQRVNNRVA